jgi:hypothetical protein
MSNNFRLTAAAGLGLLLASVAAPIALADVPGYDFQDFNQSSSATDSRSATGAATAAQIGVADRKADQALALARQAIREAEARQQPMQAMR